MLKLAPNPSYSLNLLNLLNLSVDSSLFPLIPLILDFLCLILFLFHYFALTSRRHSVEHREDPTSDGSKFFFSLYDS